MEKKINTRITAVADAMPKRLTKAERDRQEREEAREHLRSILKPGDTVYTILRHVSRSGMFRRISLLTEDMQSLDYWTIRAGIGNERKGEGIGVSGYGMDMGFNLVYTLGRILWPDGVPCTGPNCRSNDHANGMPRPKTQREAKKIKHSDSGYALTQRWI